MHSSDCALHNAPAMPPRRCSCGAGMRLLDWVALLRARVFRREMDI